MTRYIAIAALVAALVAGAALWVQTTRLGAVQAENERLTRNAAVLDRQLEQARLSASVAAAHAKREREITANANATIEAIRNLDLGECADAQLDPDLADALDGVFRDED